MDSFFSKRHFCPSCGSLAYKTLVKKPFNDPEIQNFIKNYYEQKFPDRILGDEIFEIAECGCGFIWQTNVLNQAGMKQYYSNWIDPVASLNKRKNAKLSYYIGLSKNIAVCKMKFDNSTLLKSLDYGMGWGHWAVMAMAFGFESYGYEITEDRIEYAKNCGIKTINNIHEIASSSFHLINAEQVLEHVPNPKETMDDLSRLLANGGLLHIAVPDGRKDADILRSNRWSPHKGPTQPIDHINTFTPRTLNDIAEKSGLKLVKLCPRLNLLRLKNIKLNAVPKNLYLNLMGTSLYFTK